MSRVRRGELALSDAPPEVAEVLELCRKARDASDGWFDPWAMPGGVDPTGLVKGWAAGRALDEFRRAGLPRRHGQRRRRHRRVRAPGARPGWRIGIRDPLAHDRICWSSSWRARRVATSGAYERGEHIVDRRRRASRQAGLLAATVIGHDLGYADALATALYASGGELLGQASRAGGLPRVSSSTAAG